MKQRNLWLLAGPPGSGKTTWVQEKIKKDGGTHISRDAIRFSFLTDDEDYFAKEKKVFSTFIDKIKESFLFSNDVYADATHLTPSGRNKIIKALDLPKDIAINIIWFVAPLEVCLSRNATRKGRAYVPEEVIIDMYNKAIHPQCDNHNYNAILEINEYGECCKNVLRS